MASLENSKFYGNNPNKNNFIGFGAVTCGAVTSPVDNEHRVRSAGPSPIPSTTVDVHCDLTIGTYEMGVYGHFGGQNYYGASITHEGLLGNEDDTLTDSATPTTICI